MSDRQVCVNCGKGNPQDAAYCIVCGHILPHGMRRLSTHSLDEKSGLQPQIRWGTAYFGDQTLLEIRIHHTGTVIEETCGMACVVGRAAGDSRPDIDLAPFGALELGVSRRHAMFTRRSATIMIQDLDSVNGTYLNGERLVPKQPRVLRNQDEVTLGQMTLQVSFKKVTGPLETQPAESEDEMQRLISEEDRMRLSPPQTGKIAPRGPGVLPPAEMPPPAEQDASEKVPARTLLPDKLLSKPVPAEPDESPPSEEKPKPEAQPTPEDKPKPLSGKLQPKAPPVPPVPGVRPAQPKAPPRKPAPEAKSAKPDARPAPASKPKGRELPEGPSQHVAPAAKPGDDVVAPPEGKAGDTSAEETPVPKNVQKKDAPDGQRATLPQPEEHEQDSPEKL